MTKRDQEFEKKYQEVKDIKTDMTQRYYQMKADRDDNLKKMDLMDQEIQKYRDNFSFKLIEAEAQIIKMD
jgi:hypothetical protein